MAQGILLILDSINIKKLSANDMFLNKFQHARRAPLLAENSCIQNGYTIAIL